MSALGRMSGIADKFSTASDLMQGAADDARDENVQIKEKQPRSPNRASSLTPKKENKVQQMTSRSRPEAQAIKHYNEHNQTVINKHLPAPKDSAKDLQTKQVALAQQQAISMKQLNNTMAEILHVLERDKNKITPKYQEFSKSKGYGEINGQARDGMIDKLGSMMGDLMRDFKDTLGGLADSLGKKKSNSRRARDRLARRRESARIRAGGAPGAGPGGGGWWSNAGQRVSNMFGGGGGAGHGGGHGGGAGGGGAPRPAGGGGGRVGTALKIAAAGAAAVGGYEGVKWVGGKLGMVAKSEESGKGGVGTVSTGKGDHGGVSYGSHQLSSNKGSMAAYLQSPDGQPYAQELAGLQPGSAAFTAKYKEIAARDPVAFEKSQDSYLARTHYSPQVNKVSKDTGEDFSKRGRGIQEMLYSTGVQYGPGSGVVGAALKGMDTKNMSDAQIIQTVQDYKNKTTNVYFKRSDADTKASVAARALREKDKLLAVDKQEREAKAAGVKAEEEPKQNVTMAEAAGKAAPAAKPQEDPVAVATPTPSAIFNPSAADLMAPPATPAPTPVASAPVSGPELESETVGIMPLTAAAAGIGAGAFMPAMPKIDPTVPRGGATATPGAASGAGRRMSKLLPGASVAIGAYDAYGILSDEQATKEEKERGLAGVGGGMAGAAAGGMAGAAAGSLFFGVGAIPGAIVGGGLGLVGGMLGYDLGASAGESLYDAAKGSPEEQRESEVASSNMPVAGSTPLLMLTQQHADETGDKQSVSAAAAMATVDAAIQKSMAPVRARTQEELEMEATQKAYDQMVKDFPSPRDATTAPEAIAPATAPVTGPNAAPFAAKEETYEILTGPNTKPNVMPALPTAEGEVKILPASSAVTSSVPQSPQEVNAMFANAATAGAAAGVASAAKTLPQALSKEKTPEAEGMMSKIAGGLSGVAGALAAGLGLPPGWAESITSGYGQALAEQSAAMNGSPSPKAPTTPSAQSAQPQAQSTLPLPTTPASALTPVSKPVQELQEGEVTVLPGAGSTPPVVTAPVASQPVAPTSPASPEYYKDMDVAPSASSLAAASTPSTVASSAASAPTVSSTAAAPAPVERQQYEPVKSVMMLEPKTQDTLMPERAQPPGERMPSQGVSEGGSVRPTIDEACAIITDQGLVLLQTGMI